MQHVTWIYFPPIIAHKLVVNSTEEANIANFVSEYKKEKNKALVIYSFFGCLFMFETPTNQIKISALL